MADQISRENRKRALKSGMISQKAPSDDEQQLKKLSRRSRKIRRIVTLLVVIAVTAAAVGIFLYLRYYKYTVSEVRWEKDLNQGSLVGYEQFGKGFLKYSRDGITCLSAKGEENWVESYEMKNPVISVNGDFAAVADQQSTSVMIFGEDGKTGEATALLPITKVAVSGTGVAAVIEEDADSSYITFFRKDGTALDITIKTILSHDGYPTDLALSPDGQRLMVSYEYIDGQSLKGRVVFYDFSEIGKNVPNRLVGGFDEPFAKSLLAKVCYLDSTWSFAAADTGLCFFSSKNLASPALAKEIPETDEILNVFHSAEYVGIVLKNADASGRYRLEVYRPNGKLVLKKTFDDPYQYAGIDGDFIFVYGSNICKIYNLAGTEKFSRDVDFPISIIRAGAMPNEFIAAGPASMRALRMH